MPKGFRCLTIGISFCIAIAIGLQITFFIRDRAIAHLPGEDVFEAIGRDEVAMRYTLIGYFHTFVIALIAAYVAQRLVAPRQRRE